MRAVLSGDRQAIVITPTYKDIRASQGLVHIAAITGSDHSLKAGAHLVPITVPYPLVKIL